MTVEEQRLDAAEDRRIGEALTALLPALERFAVEQPSSGVPAYVPGTVASEPLDLPSEGAGLDAVLGELATAVEHGCRINAPGFSGFITVGATTAGVVAQTASAVAGGQRYLLHAFNALERTGLRWLAQLCGLPAGVAGVFTSGGSTANLVALGAARQAAYERLGVDVAEDCLPGGAAAPAMRIYASERGHRTIHRSAAVLGLGRAAVRAIPTDERDRIDLRALDAAMREDAAAGIAPLATVAVAGTTDTGAVDRVSGVVEVARRHGSWVHVDGAYGLVANASPSTASLFDGVADADSWIVDPHKWLSTGLGVGAAFVRDEALLVRAFAEGHAAYLDAFDELPDVGGSQFDDKGGTWDDMSVELSAPPRGVLVWAVLREIGRQGVADRVERHVGFARTLADRVRREERLELRLEPDLSIVCFRYRPARDDVETDRLNRAITAWLRRETPYVPTSTVVRGRFAIRPCFINPRATLADVHGLVDAVLRAGAELE